MRISLFQKFSLSILSICVLGIALVWVSTRVLFESFFLDYINKQGESRIEQITERLADSYEEMGSWDHLRERDRLWRQLVTGRGAAPFPFYERRPQPHSQEQKGRQQQTDRRLGSPDTVRRERFSPEIVLIDEQGNRVAGKWPQAPEKDINRLPIIARDETVGYLVWKKYSRVAGVVGDNVAASLNRSISLALVSSLIFALLAATLLARNLSRPISKLSEATRELARGKYEMRLGTDRTDEIGQLVNDFDQLAKTLEAGRSSQQRWIADISHELRTPLAVLRAELMAMEDGVRKLDEASLGSLINEVERFSRLVNDLYDLSRADAGDLDYRMEPLDLSELAEGSVEQFQHSYSEKNLSLCIQKKASEIIINADFDRINQLLSNLLENSLRYTDSGGQTKLLVDAEEADAVLTIEDSAPSVPKGSMDRIFERLYRVESSRSRQHGGGGLGLALCKAIVDSHQGSISAQASDIGGLCIVVRLPLAKH